MELLPLVCLCLLSWSGTTSADHHVVVEEGSDVILPCSFDVNIGGERLEWKKDGQMVLVYNGGILSDNDLKQLDDRFSHFQYELKRGNASLKIRNTKVSDSGNYTCDVPNNPREIVHVKLVVGGELKDRTGENIPGAAPKPSVTILLHSKTSALLQCEAHGVPDPEVHWQDSDGNILPAEKTQVTGTGGLVYITLNTTVTKTDRFYCVVTQMKLSHRVSAGIHVYVDEDKPQPVNTGHVVVAAVVAVFVTLFVVAVGFVLCRRCTR